MDTSLTKVYINSVLGSFTFKCRMFVWDSYQCYIEESIKTSLKGMKIDIAIIPGGCTKYIQAPDVSWNKPFKQKVTDLYNEWLSTEGLERETAAGNLKAPPRKCVLQWVLTAWQSVPQELIIKSFRVCALSLPNDNSCDDEIHCFKPKQPCSAGRELLKSQLAILSEPDNNPFTTDSVDIDENDIADATPEFMLLDSDSEEEEELDLLD